MMRFSQRMTWFILTFSTGIVALTIVLNFLLLWNGKQPMAQETIAGIQVYGGVLGTAATITYGMLSGFRDGFKNKTIEG